MHEGCHHISYRSLNYMRQLMMCSAVIFSLLTVLTIYIQFLFLDYGIPLPPNLQCTHFHTQVEKSPSAQCKDYLKLQILCYSRKYRYPLQFEPPLPPLQKLPVQRRNPPPPLEFPLTFFWVGMAIFWNSTLSKARKPPRWWETPSEKVGNACQDINPGCCLGFM